MPETVLMPVRAERASQSRSIWSTLRQKRLDMLFNWGARILAAQLGLQGGDTEVAAMQVQE